MTRRIVITLATLFVAAGAFAQLPPGKWWRRPEIVRTLNLTDEQQDHVLAALFLSCAA